MTREELKMHLGSPVLVWDVTADKLVPVMLTHYETADDFCIRANRNGATFDVSPETVQLSDEDVLVAKLGSSGSPEFYTVKIRERSA